MHRVLQPVQARIIVRKVMATPEPWKASGLLKGIGIPSPSGQHAVGCVDLMHHLDGDSQGGLLVRLFYPANASEGIHRYADWTPNKRYIKGYMDFKKVTAPGLKSGILSMFVSPKVPAVYGAPLLGSSGEGVKPETDQPNGEGVEPESDQPSGEGVKPESDQPSGEGVKPESDQPSDEGVASKPANQGTGPPPVFPVIVFSHGLGAMRTSYCGICSDLASNGYVVASVEHRDRSACVSLRRVARPGAPENQFQDEWLEFYHLRENEKEFPLRNQQVHQRSDDVKRSLDLLYLLNEGGDIHNMLEENIIDFKQFQGCLDVSTAAVIGHSFGGSTTIQTLSEDPRFRCGIALDCWMVPIHKDLYETGIQQPLLFINSHDFQWVENVQRMMKLAKPPNENGISNCSVLTLRGTNHFSQTDVVFVVPTFAMRWGNSLPQVDRTEAHNLNLEICHLFLKRHLFQDGRPIPNLDGGEGSSDQIIFGTNLDLSKEVEGEDKGEEGKDKAEGEGEMEEVVESTQQVHAQETDQQSNL